MARDGTPTVIKLSRKIARIAGERTLASLATATTPEFAAAIGVLVAAVAVFEALDDQPGEVDSTFPIRSGEDIGG